VNLTIQDVEAAMSVAPTLGDRLIALVSLRKRAVSERQTATNRMIARTISDAEAELVQDASQAVLRHINNHRIGVEALIK